MSKSVTIFLEGQVRPSTYQPTYWPSKTLLWPDASIHIHDFLQNTMSLNVCSSPIKIIVSVRRAEYKDIIINLIGV